MKAVDTNVVARFLLVDDDRQSTIASDLLREPVWITATVWLELGWVLATRAGMDRAMVADALEGLLGFDTVHTDDRDGMLWAIAHYRAGADWGDMVHLVTARAVADTFATFDRGIARSVIGRPLLPIETLG